MITGPVVFWNLERLFAAGSHIEAALGDGSPPATTPDELSARLRVLGGVLEAIGGAHGLPALVGLAEIETAGLITRLVRSSGLALESVEGDTADEAGVPLEGLDVTLLYDPAVFKPAVRIRSHVLDRTFDTRDVLEVDLPLRADDTIVKVLVCHWPSRLSLESAERRLAVSYFCRQIALDWLRYPARELWNAARGRLELPVKSELEARSVRPFVIMGDFNDEPFDRSLELLEATPDLSQVTVPLRGSGRTLRDRYVSYNAWTPRLWNGFWGLGGGQAGTYYRSPRWRTYDQVVVSAGAAGLLGARKAATLAPASIVVDGRRVTLTTADGRPLSYDPAKGRGASDHLPVGLLKDG